MEIINNSKYLYFGVFILLALLLGNLVMILKTGSKSQTHYLPLYENVLKSNLEIANAHLLLEEVLSKDQHESMEDVLNNFELARKRLVQSKINFATGPFPTELTSTMEIIQHLDQAIHLIVRMKTESKERFQNFEISGAGSESDVEFDEIYERFNLECQNIQKTILIAIQENTTLLQRVQLTFILILFGLILFLLFIFYQFELKQKKSLNRIKNLASYLDKAQEKEKESLARDLHDHFGQVLTSILLDLHNCIQFIQSEKYDLAIAPLSRSKEQVQLAVSNIRKTISDLRPRILEEQGLIPAIEWLVDQYRQRSEKTDFVLNVSEDFPRLDKEIEVFCFRLIQEALTNAIKHSDATKIEVLANFVSEEQQVSFEVKDNGKGVHLRSPDFKMGHGLYHMHERAQRWGATIKMKSRPGLGFSIFWSIQNKSANF